MMLLYRTHRAISVSSTTRRSIGQVLSLSLCAATVGYMGWILLRGKSEALAMLQNMNTGLSIASVLALMGAMIPFAYAVVVNLRMLGHHVSMIEAAHAYFMSQFGKYVPGKMLLAVIRGKIYAEYRIPPSVSAVSLVIEVLLSVASAVFVTLILLPFSSLLRSVVHPLWVLPCLGVPLILCSPSVLNWCVVKLNRCGIPAKIRASQVAHCLAAYVAGWFAVGAAFVMLSSACVPVGTSWLPEAIASFPLAFLAGLLVLIAPGGLGVRELALTGILTPHLGVSNAAALAIVARCWWLAAEFGCALIGSIAARFSRKVDRMKGSLQLGDSGMRLSQNDDVDLSVTDRAKSSLARMG